MSKSSEFSIPIAKASEAPSFIDLRSKLFRETEFMLRTPQEYQPSVNQESAYIDSMVSSPHSAMLLAKSDNHLVGFICASGTNLVRRRHVATVFLGVLQKHWGAGIASAMLKRIIEWAPSAGIERLELTVDTDNERASAVYKRLGFKVEGVAKRAIKIGNIYKNEQVMGLLLK